MTAYIRWKAGERREGPVCPPLPESHPLATTQCLLCGNQLNEGGRVQLLAIGPHSQETRQRHITGRWYKALAVVVHAYCLGSAIETPPAEDVRAS